MDRRAAARDRAPRRRPAARCGRRQRQDVGARRAFRTRGDRRRDRCLGDARDHVHREGCRGAARADPRAPARARCDRPGARDRGGVHLDDPWLLCAGPARRRAHRRTRSGVRRARRRSGRSARDRRLRRGARGPGGRRLRGGGSGRGLRRRSAAGGHPVDLRTTAQPWPACAAAPGRGARPRSRGSARARARRAGCRRRARGDRRAERQGPRGAGTARALHCAARRRVPMADRSRPRQAADQRRRAEHGRLRGLRGGAGRLPRRVRGPGGRSGP